MVLAFLEGKKQKQIWLYPKRDFSPNDSVFSKFKVGSGFTGDGLPFQTYEFGSIRGTLRLYQKGRIYSNLIFMMVV